MLKAGNREFANLVLGEKRAYQFVEVIKNEDGEEDTVPIKINGFACRTPDEDIVWEQE